MKLTVVGTGYVGLVTGVCLAKFGNTVVCVDTQADKIALLKGGKVPFFEPGLEEMIRTNTAAGRLFFSTDIAPAVEGSAIALISVGTPSREDGGADLSFVESAVRGIGRAMTDHTVIVVKSTVPVGTCDFLRDTVAEELERRGADIPFDVVSNPEFLREGAALQDFLHPDRVIVGVDNRRSERVMEELYSFLPREKLIFMDIRSAEMTKYTANAMLATRISFMNEIASVCERTGADVEKVRLGIGSDSRIGYPFLNAGCGFGGSCFPKDVRALQEFARRMDVETPLLHAVELVNERQKHLIAQRILHHFQGSLGGRIIALWGLAFKPKTSDVREATAQTVIRDLVEAGASVRAHDPRAMDEMRGALGELSGVQYFEDQYETLRGADALALLTEWDIYKQPDFDRMRKLLAIPVVFDGRNQYSPADMRRKGFVYYSVGRPQPPR